MFLAVAAFPLSHSRKLSGNVDPKTKTLIPIMDVRRSLNWAALGERRRAAGSLVHDDASDTSSNETIRPAGSPVHDDASDTSSNETVHLAPALAVGGDNLVSAAVAVFSMVHTLDSETTLISAAHSNQSGMIASSPRLALLGQIQNVLGDALVTSEMRAFCELCKEANLDALVAMSKDELLALSDMCKKGVAQCKQYPTILSMRLPY
jgi:hypothetical protein